jgi:hypothetical protein
MTEASLPHAGTPPLAITPVPNAQEGRNMHTVTQPPDSAADPLPPPHVTPYFRQYVERFAAAEGLPLEPWPLP